MDDMPKLKKNEEEEVQVESKVNNSSQEKIEIPVEYYQKIEKEKQERLKKLEEEERKNEEVKGSGATFIQIILNALIFFGLLYFMINTSKYAIFAIPGYIVLVSIFTSISKKKENNYNVTVLVGGMLLALICFIVAMSNKEKEDLFIYYALASAVVGFVGYVLSSIICKLICDSKNIKALETIFYILILAAMVGAPYYFYTNYKEDFIRYVFNEENVIEATTEEEFIISNLKNRYHLDVTCSGGVKNYMDQIYKRIVTSRTCNIADRDVTVNSIAYDTTNVEYIVKDSLLDDLYIKDIKKELKDKIADMVNSNKVTISLYPDNKCYFIGDCENDSNDKNSNYKNEIKIENLYTYGRELELEQYLNLSKEEFFNKYGFRIYILVKADFLVLDTNYLENLTNSIIDLLTKNGYKNVKGFEIILEDSETLENVYHIKGNANSDQTFTDYELIDG